jgi:hypothetical protein
VLDSVEGRDSPILDRETLKIVERQNVKCDTMNVIPAVLSRMLAHTLAIAEELSES